MGFLDKAKAAAEQAAAQAKEGVEDVLAERELSHAYTELGKAAFELTESGDLSHPRLEALAERIRALTERAASGEPLAGATAGGTSETHDPSQPPAMPIS
jgi:hypothetical protein